MGGYSERTGVSMGADRKAINSEAAAHLRLVMFVSLRMAASAMAPSAPMLFSRRLRARGRIETVRKYTRRTKGTDTERRTLGSRFSSAGGILERLQRGVALEALGESSSSFATEIVERETASMGAGVAGVG